MDNISIWTKSHLTPFHFFPTMSDNLLFHNTANILYAMLRSVIGLESLKFNLCPFLNIGYITPSYHCVGSVQVIQPE
jgi:hypothetical protein